MCMVLPYDNFFRWAARVVQGVGERRSAILPSANARSDEGATVSSAVLCPCQLRRLAPSARQHAARVQLLRCRRGGDSQDDQQVARTALQPTVKKRRPEERWQGGSAWQSPRRLPAGRTLAAGLVASSPSLAAIISVPRQRDTTLVVCNSSLPLQRAAFLPARSRREGPAAHHV